MTRQEQVAIRAVTPLLVLEIALWLLAAGSVCVLLSSARTAWAARREAARVVAAPSAVADVPDAADAVLQPGQVMGTLTIPALHMTVPIVEGDGAESLRKGAGHIPGTAMPGGLGNLGLAAHRDTFFRPLRHIRAGMQVDVADSHGRWTYLVEQTAVVAPNRIDLLGIGERPELTLVTCYPFEYIGAAPQRYVVSARLLSADSSR